MYNVGDRWIWRDDNDILRGYISELKPGRTRSIIIKWENGRMTQYNDYMIEEESRLSYDKEYYRNQQLEILGI
jgi:hypothetical protein